MKTAQMAINVQMEAVPDFKGEKTTIKVMDAMNEGINEIKTALDDWIMDIKNYNVYRHSFRGRILGIELDDENPVQTRFDKSRAATEDEVQRIKDLKKSEKLIDSNRLKNVDPEKLEKFLKEQEKDN